MDSKITAEILDDLIPSLESLEAKSTAVLEFLKKEGIANDEKLAPYLEQAATASNIRWLAVRVRMERLLSSAEKESENKRSKESEDKRSKESEDKRSKEFQDKRSKETEPREQEAKSTPTRPNEMTTADAQLKDRSKAAGEKNLDNNGSRTRQPSGKEADAASTAEDNDSDRGTNQETERNVSQSVSTHTEKKIA
jgi:hypothetical protein